MSASSRRVNYQRVLKENIPSLKICSKHINSHHAYSSCVVLTHSARLKTIHSIKNLTERQTDRQTDKTSTVAEMDREERVQIIILCHNNTQGPRNLIPLLQTFSTFFILVIIYLLFNHKPTRVKENSLIDNVLTNSLSEEIKSCVLYSDLSDHFPI